MKVAATNKRARFEYFIEDTYEAGIVLEGSEVKSIRAGQISINDAFVNFRQGEAFINNMYIKHYANAANFKPNETRPRKLLLHKGEITKLSSVVKEKGKTVIPLKVYLNKNLVKAEIALAKGKHLYDKREAIKKRDIMRDARVSTARIKQA
ncbi:MAG: SsrA-binding protein SmpB [Firmicutes bacterium]|nr:SsrA-binding protein SmpB [Bacillota bacterium]